MELSSLQALHGKFSSYHPTYEKVETTPFTEKKRKNEENVEKTRKKYLPLPVRRKRNLFTNRVGKQASIMRSQYFVHVPVNGNTFTKKSNNKKKTSEKGNKNKTSNQLNRKRKSVHIPINKYVQNDCKKRKFEPSEQTNDLTIQTKSRASCPQPVINKGQPEPEGSKLNLDNKDLAFETEDGPISSGKTQQLGKGLSSNPIVIDETSPYPDYWINCNIDDETTITLYAESKKRILQSNYWLADSEIHAGQKLLKKQHPFISGFHSPSIRGDLVVPEPSEFIQIINTGGSSLGLSINHWLSIRNC